MPSGLSSGTLSRGRLAFEQDELIQVWVIHRLLVIGEAAGRLGRAFHAAHPGIPWPQIVYLVGAAAPDLDRARAVFPL